MILFVCLCAATPARAGERVELVTADLTGPPGASRTWQGVELEARYAIPLPAADVGDARQGMHVGLSVTVMANPNVGGGLDLAYHEWPASDAFRSGFDSQLRNETFNLVQLGGTTWSFHALQMTAHLRFALPLGNQVRPWLQIGAGVYSVDANVEGFQADEGTFSVQVGSLPRKAVAGHNASVGVDLVRGGHMTFGLDASYDHLSTTQWFGSNFKAFAIGGHLSYGL